MSAPLSTNIPISRKTFKFYVIGHLLLISTLLCLVLVPLNRNSSLDSITNALSSIKVNSFLIILFHLTFQVILKNVSGTNGPYRFNVKELMRVLFLSITSVFTFHLVTVLFGAAFTEYTAETFHFALLLTCTTIVPSFIHLGTSSENWVKVFAFCSPEPGTETLAYIATICSAFGGWLGAFPIPLDWDRPWQTWPISCSLGVLFGHCLGLLLNSIYICTQFYKTNKFKLI